MFGEVIGSTRIPLMGGVHCPRPSRTLTSSRERTEPLIFTWWRAGRITPVALLALTLLLTGCEGREAGQAPVEEQSGTTKETPDPQAGTGPLISLESGTFGFTDFSAGTDKSFGIFVCITGDEVDLESVEAMSSSGDIELLGGLLYEAEDGFVGAVNGFPPRGLDDSYLTDIPGATVVTACDDDLRSQVVVGANRIGPAGGKIEGIRIGYTGGVLEVSDYNIILCGDQNQLCEDVATGSDPGT